MNLRRCLCSVIGLASTVMAMSCSTREPATAPTPPSVEGAPSSGATTPAPSSGATTKSSTATAATNRPTVTPQFFDAKSVHTVEIAFDRADYDRVIARYREDSEKDWMKAEVTIDGQRYRQVGMRLKGNSSLFTIGGRRPPGFPGARNLPDGPRELPGARNLPEGVRLPEFGPGRGPGGAADAEKPETLPWLIRLDKYIDDQAHQGTTEFVVRSSMTKTALNEIVALELLDDAGLASQRSASVRLRVNGGAEILRLVIENPNQQWMEDHFGPRGSLFKADSSGDYSYRGADPTLYSDAWSHEAGEEDFRPLIDFLYFVNESTDEEFGAELPRRLDIESFATYLAIQELFKNFDDIDGPGNNSYLHYDQRSKRFTVVAWDHNLAFIGFPFGGPGGVDGGPKCRGSPTG